jgi:glycosyltransferase involved in cell wall biosynthesis
MKIVFDHKIFFQQQFGGPSRYFSQLFEHLNKNRATAYIISPFYTNEYLKSSIFKKNIYGKKISSKPFFGRGYNYLNKNISKLIISKLNPDVIHTTYYDEHLINQKKPIILTVHDMIHEIFHNDFGFDVHHRPKKKMIDRADHIICVSESTKKDLIEYYNVKEEKISTIYHGASTNQVHKKPSLKIEKPFFLYIGSRKRYKNFKKFLEAFSLNDSILKNFDIICFGGGSFLPEEYQLFNALKINNNQIHNFNGDDDLLTYLYQNAQALIYPSIYEGFGMPILEAMRLKCPVISSNSSSMPEVYGNTCLPFNPNSKEELALHLDKISNNSDFRNQIIQDAHQRSKLFTWEKCAEETLKVYKNLI